MAKAKRKASTNKKKVNAAEVSKEKPTFDSLEAEYLNNIPKALDDSDDENEEEDNMMDENDDEMNNEFSFFSEERDETNDMKSDSEDDDTPNDLFGKVYGTEIDDEQDEEDVSQSAASKISAENGNDNDDEEQPTGDQDSDDEIGDDNDEDINDSDEEEDNEVTAADDMSDDDEDANENDEDDNDEEDSDEEEIDRDDENEEAPEVSDDFVSDYKLKGNVRKKGENDDVEIALEKEEFDESFFSSENDTPALAHDVTFNEMPLSRPLKKAVSIMGFIHPTPIQAKTIPLLIKGGDICASAVTGSGKTAAFLLPILEKLLYRNKNDQVIRALVLLPTRELAAQCFNVLTTLARFTDLTMCLCVGGDINPKKQTDALRRNPDIVIATPGRIVDHLVNTADFGLDSIEYLVLDEADRLLELGFQKQLEEILNSIPKSRQTMLFSATMTDSVADLIKMSLKNPRRVAIDNRADVSGTLTQEFVRLKGRNQIWREGTLLSLVTRTFQENVIIFVNRRETAKRLVILFKLRKLLVSELHGNLSQSQRLAELRQFAQGKSDFLICTDVAARGLDIKNVKTVINFEMPIDLKTYIHRVGRTARAGMPGISVSLSGEDDRLVLKQVVKRAKKKGDVIKQRVVPNEIVLYWTNKIENMATKINRAIKEEQIERELKQTEMKVQKMKNMVEFAGEIAARPKKQWIMSEKEKVNLKKRERDEKGLDNEGKKIQRTQYDQDATHKRLAEKAKNLKRNEELNRREKRKLKQIEEEKEALAAHGIKDLASFVKKGKNKAKKSSELLKQGIVTDQMKLEREAAKEKKKAKVEKKKAKKLAKQEKIKNSKSEEKREEEQIAGEIFKNNKPIRKKKTKSKFKRRK